MTSTVRDDSKAGNDLVGRLRAGGIDWDNSFMPDGAEPMPGVDVGLLREAADRIEALEKALTEISCPTQTEKLLWWQALARRALARALLSSESPK